MFRPINGFFTILGLLLIILGAGSVIINILVNDSLMNILTRVGISAVILAVGYLLVRIGAGGLKYAIEWVLSLVIRD